MSTAEAVPKMHKACVYDQPGTCSIAIRDVPTPKPGPNEVLIKLTHSGICHSDYAIMMNTWRQLPVPTQTGQIGGHEGLGHIVKLGEGSEKLGVKIGDRVGVKWVASACLACPPCTESLEGYCFNQKVSGYYTPGTFQEYVIGPANYVTPVPESLSGEVGAPMLCAGLTTWYVSKPTVPVLGAGLGRMIYRLPELTVTAVCELLIQNMINIICVILEYSALLKCGASPGQWVVISGAGGGLGTTAVSLAARGMGYRVIGIDMPGKKQDVLDSGAEHFIDVTQFDDATIGKEVKRLTGLGAKAVIVCANSNKAYGQAVSMLRFGGSLVCVGMPEGEQVSIANAYPSSMIMAGHNIVVSAVGNRREAIDVMEMAARGVVKFPVRTVSMSELQSVFEEMSQAKVTGRVVIDFSAA